MILNGETCFSLSGARAFSLQPSFYIRVQFPSSRDRPLVRQLWSTRPEYTAEREIRKASAGTAVCLLAKEMKLLGRRNSLVMAGMKSHGLTSPFMPYNAPCFDDLTRKREMGGREAEVSEIKTIYSVYGYVKGMVMKRFTGGAQPRLLLKRTSRCLLRTDSVI